MDRSLLAAAYDRSAPLYDEQFRALQRPKFSAAAALCEAARAPAAGALCLDAGAGTGLFAEWLADASAEPAAARARLAAGRWLALDLSRAMLQRARARTPLVVAGDLARPPLAPGACAAVVAFTSILGPVRAALAALGALVAPGGFLLATFLAAEAPPAASAAAAAGLRLAAPPVRAGQDQLFLFTRSAT